MLKLPRGLRVIERRRVAGELELLHHLLRAAVFAFEQKRHEDLELDQLRRLILVAAGRLRLKSASKRSRALAYSFFLNGICARLYCASRNFGSAFDAFLNVASA